MPISSPNSAAKIRLSHPLLPSPLHRNSSNSPSILHRNLLSIRPFSRLRCAQTVSSATAQNCSVEFESMDLEEKYAREVEVAVKAVHMASLLCRRVQESLIFKSNVHVHSKDDDSPVTVAGIILPPARPSLSALQILKNAIFFLYFNFGRNCYAILRWSGVGW